MRWLPARPNWPCAVRSALPDRGRDSGRTMYQPMPALVAPPTVTAVSSAPYNWPLAYVTCCIRVSLLSSSAATSGLNGSGPPTTTAAQASSLRHCASGTEPGFWLAAGGNEYVFTRTRLSFNRRSGRDVLSDSVLVRLHVTMLLET